MTPIYSNESVASPPTVPQPHVQTMWDYIELQGRTFPATITYTVALDAPRYDDDTTYNERIHLACYTDNSVNNYMIYCDNNIYATYVPIASGVSEWATSTTPHGIWTKLTDNGIFYGRLGFMPEQARAA